MKNHVDKQHMLLRENVTRENEDQDSFDGRLTLPGHSLEALWFIMVVAHQNQDMHLINQCADLMISTLNYGWDKEFGGLYYFMDIEGKPPQQLEWNQKLWWVHIEAMIACALGFQLTSREDFAEWYQKLHQYSWEKFHDKEHGEWWGYLERRGEVLLQLKGGKWKGFFHMPRGLFVLSKIFNDIARKYEQTEGKTHQVNSC